MTRFFPVVAADAPAQPDQVPVMYLNLVATGTPSPAPPSVTLTMEASGAASIPFQGGKTELDSPTVAGFLAVAVSYDRIGPAPAPDAGESRFQLAFFLVSGSLDAMRSTPWSIRLDAGGGGAGQSFSWTVTDSADDAHAAILPVLAARRATLTGPVTVTGTTSLATQDGGVGIGVASPRAKLHVFGNAPSEQLIVQIENTDPVGQARLRIIGSSNSLYSSHVYVGSSGAAGDLAGSSIIFGNSDLPGSSAAIKVRTSTSASDSGAMTLFAGGQGNQGMDGQLTILPSGNVGVSGLLTANGGVTAPSVTATTTAGVTAPQVTVRSNNNTGIGPLVTLANGVAYPGAAGAGAAIHFNAYDPGQNDPAARIQSLGDANGSSHLTVLTKQPGAATNPLVERLRITSTGDVVMRKTMLKLGTTDGSTASANEVVGGIGFQGAGFSHGEFAYRAGRGFEFVDTSANAPRVPYNIGDYPYAPVFCGALSAAGDTFVGAALAFAPKPFTAASATDTLTAAAHGLVTGDGPVRVATSNGLPEPLVGGRDYWVIRLTADTFQLAASLALAVTGSPINLTSDGTGTHTLSSTASTAHPRNLTVTGNAVIAGTLGVTGQITVADVTAGTMRVTNAAEAAVAPLVVSRDYLGNIRSIVDHTGYRMGQVSEIDETWMTASVRSIRMMPGPALLSPAAATTVDTLSGAIVIKDVNAVAVTHELPLQRATVTGVSLNYVTTNSTTRMLSSFVSQDNNPNNATVVATSSGTLALGGNLLTLPSASFPWRVAANPVFMTFRIDANPANAPVEVSLVTASVVIDPAGWEWTPTVNGSSTAASHTYVNPSPAINHRVVQLISGTAIGSGTLAPEAYECYMNADLAYVQEWVLRTGVITDAANARQFAIGVQNNNAGSGNRFVYFYNDGGMAKWQLRVVGSATADTDTGVTIAAVTNYRMRLEIFGANVSSAPTSSFRIRGFINGALVADTISAALPATDMIRPYMKVGTTASGGPYDFSVGRIRRCWNHLLAPDAL